MSRAPVSIIVGIVVGLAPSIPGAQDQSSSAGVQPGVVVGTFDSRGVLMAYVRSQSYREYLAAQQADVRRVTERARAAGDVALVADLNALGPAVQQRIHEQGFGTAPVGDIIALIEDRLPAIAEAAGVDVIVSRWDLTYGSPDAQFIDLTETLAAEFDPTEETLQGIRELTSQAPVTPETELRH